MDTPIFDFVSAYCQSGTARLHMPGHKGADFLGCEMRDITEIHGADALYEADGVIRASERNAAQLFGTADTLYSTEGSSQCIRAMLCAVRGSARNARPTVVAARNVHKAFVSAAALLDLDVIWLWDESESPALCRCAVSPAQLEQTLRTLPHRPAAVYLTSPDYLGGTADIAALAEIAHGYGVPLLVDNAHGAYLRFLPQDKHPITLGADLCCDSAHKTLPVLTGGAYLQIAKRAPTEFLQNARGAMALFGSTSPSYLILQSLDLANRYVSDGYCEKLQSCVAKIDRLKADLAAQGWEIAESDPLRLTVHTDGAALAAHLRKNGIECEFADRDFAVLMFTPENSAADFAKLRATFSKLPPKAANPQNPPKIRPPERVCTIRQAVLAPHETVLTENALGRVSASPTVSCPPAVPVAVSGERITENTVQLLQYYGIRTVEVVCSESFPKTS